jgi:hypothetical protein
MNAKRDSNRPYGAQSFPEPRLGRGHKGEIND